MVYDIDMLRNFYANFPRRVDTARERIGGRPMTLAEKILYAHLYDESSTRLFKRGEDYVNFRPDRVAMQDATAQMALLQFMNARKRKIRSTGYRALRPFDPSEYGSQDGYRYGYQKQ